MNTNALSPKTIAATGGSVVGGALTVILVWVLGLFNIVMPADVAAAISILVTAVFTFLGGYIAPHSQPPEAH